MKNLKTYKMFESSVALTPEQVEWRDECTEGTWQLNPRTGLVDVDGDFDCIEQGLSDFKGVRFGVIKRDFECRSNQLTTLEGAPREVRGGFNCSDNQLTSLKGAPREVGKDFSCEDNQLTSLKGAPREVRGHFSCENNQLTTLERAPREVGGGFYCGNNPVSRKTLKNIFSRMEKGESYLKAVGSLWTEIPVEDQTLLYRPEFEWVGTDERRKLDALRAYQGFKGMI